MASDPMDWIDKREKEIEEEGAKGYFKLQEGDNRFQMLSHAPPLAQVWDNATKRYTPATEGAKNVSIKGVCYVYQEGIIKQAMLPYTVLKQIRAYQNNDEWDISEFPCEHVMTVNAKNAGSKEVEYTLTLSPKKTPVPPAILAELKKKPSPEDIIEKIKGKKEEKGDEPYDYRAAAYSPDQPNPDEIPF